MSELIEWLSACLDDDERIAGEAIPGPWEVLDGGEGEVYAPAMDREVAYGLGRLPGFIEHTYVTCDHEGLLPSVQKKDARHIAAWDPARVLAEVAAKRRIIERLHHEPYEGLRNSWQYGEVVTEEYVSCSCGWEKVITHGHDWDDLHGAHCAELGVNPIVADAVLRLLALPYAGRDGYRDEWRPTDG